MPSRKPFARLVLLLAFALASVAGPSLAADPAPGTAKAADTEAYQEEKSGTPGSEGESGIRADEDVLERLAASLWTTCEVMKGSESTCSTLLPLATRPVVAVVAAVAALFAGVAPSGPSEPELIARTLFWNVNVFDGRAEAFAPVPSVLVEGNLIETISTELVDAPGATVIVT